MGENGKLRVGVIGLGFGAEFVPIYLDHPDVASSLGILAFIYDDLGKGEKAEELRRRVLAIRSHRSSAETTPDGVRIELEIARICGCIWGAEVRKGDL